MGVIEHAFAAISALIGRAVVHRGFIPAERLVHYRLHAKIDERHAEEFFAVIERAGRTPRAVTPSSRASTSAPTSSTGSTSISMR